ncbi:uncharacterized protein [Macrobrachium rosenbergii]|uniref:uncharacterized protein n=1 Tax=Macrobrachium rosenbergii TaxID=79674 RepID=UPI0034D41DBA
MLLLLTPRRFIFTRATPVSVESLNVRESLDNPCSIELGGQPLSVAYNIEGATYTPAMLLSEISRANHSIDNIRSVSEDLGLCVPTITDRLATFPAAPNLQGKTYEQAFHIIHKELVYILAHFYFAQHDFNTFREHCIIHFPDAFGSRIVDSIGKFKNILCNVMTRIGYSPLVQQNLEDINQVWHDTGMGCSERRDWTCVLLSSTRHALNELRNFMYREEVQRQGKRAMQSWNLLHPRKTLDVLRKNGNYYNQRNALDGYRNQVNPVARIWEIEDVEEPCCYACSC